MITFFCVCVGEYTAQSRQGRQQRTQQFLVNYVKIFKLSKTCGLHSPFPINASKQELLSQVVETLSINEQFFFKGACVHHGLLKGQTFACPLKALARLVTHIQVHTYNGTTLLCEYWDSVGRRNVTDIIFHMKFQAVKLGYLSRNIPMKRIDMHLNRAGGACAMKLAGFYDKSIRKIGGQLISPYAFLEYIQQQLSGLCRGMATKMSRICKI